MKKIHQLEEQLHGEMQLKDELEQKCRYGAVFLEYVIELHDRPGVFESAQFASVFVHCRASNTKLDKIMKELDEEVGVF